MKTPQKAVYFLFFAFLMIVQMPLQVLRLNEQPIKGPCGMDICFCHHHEAQEAKSQGIQKTLLSPDGAKRTPFLSPQPFEQRPGDLRDLSEQNSWILIRPLSLKSLPLAVTIAFEKDTAKLLLLDLSLLKPPRF